MRLLWMVLTVAVSLTSNASGQDAVQGKPATELEALMQTKGRVIVRDFQDYGILSGNGKIGVSALVVYDPVGGKKQKGIKVWMKKNEHLERTVFLDIEEVGPLIKGLAQISKLTEEWKAKHKMDLDAVSRLETPYYYSEIVFLTKAGLEVGLRANTLYSAEGFMRASGPILPIDVTMGAEQLDAFRTLSERGLLYLNSR